MDALIPCHDADIAAAFATLGVSISPKVQVRVENGKEYVSLFLSRHSHTNPGLNVGQLLKQLKDGTLEQADPEHPLLYALTAIKNLHAINNTVRTQAKTLMIQIKGSQRTAYIPDTASSKLLGRAERFLHTGKP